MFRRGEEDQEFELFLNVIKSVLEFSLDEYDGTGSHFGMVGAKLHAGASANDVVHLVLMMRLLLIASASGQNIDARAHGRNTKKLKIAFALFASLAKEIVNVDVASHKGMCVRE